MPETNTPTALSVHGPYEDAIIAVATLFGKIIDGQPQETRAELWGRYLEATKPLHQLAVSAVDKIVNLFTKET